MAYALKLSLQHHQLQQRHQQMHCAQMQATLALTEESLVINNVNANAIQLIQETRVRRLCVIYSQMTAQKVFYHLNA